MKHKIDKITLKCIYCDKTMNAIYYQKMAYIAPCLSDEEYLIKSIIE